jgi:pSer/pThr/pTyr-binding forkhead associated (FHA) protein
MSSGWILESVDPAMVLRLAPGSEKSVGREARADFILEAPLVSRLHCRFIVSPKGDLTIEDLGSTNGTLVNGTRVTRSAVQPGDVITIGRVEFSATSTTG